MTVQFEVGVPRTDALVRLYNTVHSNRDWLPVNLGTSEPLIKPKGIDDVPIVSLTLWSKNQQTGAFDIERVAHSIEADLKRVKGTREVMSIGGPGRAINVELDPAKLSANGLTVADLRNSLQSANSGMPGGELVAGNRSIQVDAGEFLRDAKSIGELVVGVKAGKPVYLQDVAKIEDGALPAAKFVWHGVAGKDAAEYPAVTIAITKKPGQNAVDVATAVIARAEILRNTVIPADVEMTTTRNYGQTADDKAKKLIQKLLFATASVVALVFLALGRREAAIVGTAVILTLTVTLFASWAWGFTLNRVSLFALIFSIGILVDDAIVVVENIHRHQALFPGKTLRKSFQGQSMKWVADHSGDADRDCCVVADGLCYWLDGPLHESDTDQCEYGDVAVFGDCLCRHALAGKIVDERGISRW
jgi:multidrug efflux pump subunit AcrB